MNNCPECNSKNSMYERWDDYKCIECGYVHEYPLIGDTVPTRKEDSRCGEIISNAFEGVSETCVRRRNCNDGSMCSVTPSTTVEIENGAYMVACAFHD